MDLYAQSLQEVMQQRGLTENDLLAHTDAVFLLDHFGRYRGRYQTRWALEDLVQDVRLLLASAE